MMRSRAHFSYITIDTALVQLTKDVIKKSLGYLHSLLFIYSCKFAPVICVSLETRRDQELR